MIPSQADSHLWANIGLSQVESASTVIEQVLAPLLQHHVKVLALRWRVGGLSLVGLYKPLGLGPTAKISRGDRGTIWTSGHDEHLSFWQSVLSNFDNTAL